MLLGEALQSQQVAEGALGVRATRTLALVHPPAALVGIESKGLLVLMGAAHANGAVERNELVVALAVGGEELIRVFLRSHQSTPSSNARSFFCTVPSLR